jgi:hypothetical protein
VFNSVSIPGKERLKKNEVFAAAVTEGGYGVELAIPIRFLRFWIVDKPAGEKQNKRNKGQHKGRHHIKYRKTEPIDIRSDIYFYKVSMQNNLKPYNAAAVVDNAGSCRGGVGISGNVNVSKSITTRVIEPGKAYEFKIDYTNLTNQATELGIENIVFNTNKIIQKPADPTDYSIRIYPDYNCNGVVDHGVEDIDTPYIKKNVNDYAFDWYMDDTSFHDGNLHLDSTAIVLAPYYGSDYSLYNNATELILPAYGKGCFIAYLALKTEEPITAFDITFQSSLFFMEGREFCEPSCGSKPINSVGFVSTSVGNALLVQHQRGVLDKIAESTSGSVNIYPNPSAGNVVVSLPQREGLADVTIEDYLGRVLQQWKKVGSTNLQLTRLNPGSYIVKVRFHRTGRVEARKLIVQ